MDEVLPGAPAPTVEVPSDVLAMSGIRIKSDIRSGPGIENQPEP